MDRGICECGCGQPTKPYHQSLTAKGYVKGVPARFVQGHNERIPLAERLWRKVDTSSGPLGCWPFVGYHRERNGQPSYGLIRDGDVDRAAHRVAWEATHGPIPDGMVVCHRCDNPPCCNPAHLFVGTQADNIRDMDAKGRGNRPGHPVKPKTHCRWGHPFSGENVRVRRTTGQRICVACLSRQNREQYALRRRDALALAHRNPHE